MRTKDTIVTALYFSTPQSRMGGRGYDWDVYQAPFKNLLYLNCNLIIFTDSYFRQQLEYFFKSTNFQDYLIIEYDLDAYRNSNTIYKIKEYDKIIDKNGIIPGMNPVNNDRNHHLCLSKLDFIEKAINSRCFKSENYYWMDGGLFHHGLIPEKYGGKERLTFTTDIDYWPYFSLSICRPDFLYKLNKKLKSDLLLVGKTKYHMYNYEIYEKYSLEKSIHIIGGIFGGKVSQIELFCKTSNEVVDTALSSGILVLEEEILTVTYLKFFKEKPILTFSEWGHDLPSEPNYLGVEPGSFSFYKLFL